MTAKRKTTKAKRTDPYEGKTIRELTCAFNERVPVVIKAVQKAGMKAPFFLAPHKSPFESISAAKHMLGRLAEIESQATRCHG
jgi:hypothetical protein